MLDHVPYQMKVDAPVTVDEPIAECDDLGPGDSAVLAQDGESRFCGGLTNDLEIPDHRVLDQPLAQEGLAASDDIGIDRGNGVGDPRVKPEDKHAPDRDDWISQRPGVGLDVRAEVRTDAARQNEIDLAAQQEFKLLDQCEIVAEPAMLGQIDQQIDVAVRTLLAAGHRAEQAQVRRTVPRGNLVQRVAVLLEFFAQGHGLIPVSSEDIAWFHEHCPRRQPARP